MIGDRHAATNKTLPAPLLKYLFEFKLNFGLKTPLGKQPTLGVWKAPSLLKMKTKDELPENLKMKNNTLPKKSSVDHLNTSNINDTHCGFLESITRTGNAVLAHFAD